MAPAESALVYTLDSSRGTQQRAARIPAPADGAEALDEPERRVGLHGSVWTRRVGGHSPGKRVSRTDPCPLPHGVGAVRYPTPRRSNVVPHGLQAADYLG